SGIVHSVDNASSRVVADLLLLPGNSGGPLADAHGRVLGVNSMVVNGLAVAIGSNVVNRFLAAPGEQPYLGIVAQPVAVAGMGGGRVGVLFSAVRGLC